MNRIQWIDNAKFIGIFLVVLGHLPIPEYAINFIYSFHMPLFFFISGYLYDVKKYDTFLKFLKHRSKQLLVPYVSFNVITYLFWLFVGRKFGNDSSADISVLTPIIGMFYGTDTGNYLIHCGSLWFLPCLFLVEIIYYLCKQWNRYLVLILFLIVGYVNFKIDHIMLPWSFDVALVAIFFYILADILREFINKSIEIKVVYKLFICLVAFVLLIFQINFNGRSDMSSNTYNNYLIFLSAAISGTVLVIYFSSLISELTGRLIIVEYFAKNTLIILALHGIISSVIKGVLFFALKIPVNYHHGMLGINLLYTIFTFIMLVPAFYIFNNLMPFTLGRRLNIK